MNDGLLCLVLHSSPCDLIERPDLKGPFDDGGRQPELELLPVFRFTPLGYAAPGPSPLAPVAFHPVRWIVGLELWLWLWACLWLRWAG